MKRGIIYFLLLLLPGGFLSAQQLNEPVFKDGDRVCFIGNSITNNAQFYHFINLYYATRYPDRKVVFINCGISGDVTRGIINRMESDILVHKPTWTVLMIGMNDVNGGLYSSSRKEEAGIKEKQDQALELYRKNLEIIVPKLLENGRKLILQKPTIYDQTGSLPVENRVGVNDALRKCADYIQVLADKYHLPVVDYWTILHNLNREVQQKDSAATIIGNDRVHPGAPGHFIMAYEFLKTTGGAEYVSKIEIGKNIKKSTCISCAIRNLVYSDGRIEFSVKEESLPFPVPVDAQAALALVPFTSCFNKEILQIKEMPAGEYQLAIDTMQIGKYNSADFQTGINLAVQKNTPQYRQALKIMELYADYRKTQAMYRNIVTIEIHHLPDSLKNASMEARETFLNNRLEQKYKGTSAFDYHRGQYKLYMTNKPQQAEIQRKLPQIIETVYQLNKPVSHTFKLVKVSRE